MNAWVKRLAIRFLCWVVGEGLVNRGEARVLTAERDAATQAPSTRQDAVDRLREGKF